MPYLKVRSGPWDESRIEAFLVEATIPVRLASNGRTYPLVQSLWFRYERGALWCCTQSDSVLVQRLHRDPHCGFEVGADTPPYRGVRGHGRAHILDEGAHEVLTSLLDRYLSSTSTPLGTWLLSRLPNEVVIRIDDLVVSSWDYSARMSAN